MALLAVRTLSAVDEVEHFLGNDDVFHGILLALGVGLVAFSGRKRLPEAIAVVGSLSLGLWVSLLVHDWQVHGTPFDGTLPGDWWIAAVAGVVATLAAGVLVRCFWKAALTCLSAILMSFLVLAIFRLFNLPIDTLLDTHITFLSNYRVLGLVSLLVALVLCSCLMKRYDAQLLIFSAVHLGTLLLLSGLSHFAEMVFDEEPFSLIDNLAHILTAVYKDGCDEGGSSECNCDTKCKVEIVAWFVLSWLIILVVVLMKRRNKAEAEETLPEADGPEGRQQQRV